MNTRLEYSQAEGKFRQSDITDPVNPSNGYKMLCSFMNAERASRFLQAILIKFPELSFVNGRFYPSLTKMRKEVYAFVCEDIKVIDEQMEAIYKRRSQLLNI